MIAEVVLNSVTRATDNIYHYEIPDEMLSAISVGMRVTVNFGKGNKPTEAYVVGITDKSEYKELKPIVEIIGTETYFDEKAAKLAEFMKHRYFCSYCQALKVMLPAGINTKYTRTVFLEECGDDKIESAVSNSAIATAIVHELKKRSPLTFEELTGYVGRTNIMHTLAVLEKKKIIRIETRKNENIKDSYATFVTLSIDTTDAYELCDVMSHRASAQARALEMLCDSERWLLSELLECAEVSKGAVDALVQKGYAAYSKEIVRKDLFSAESVGEYIRYPLTEEQQNAYDTVADAIDSNRNETFLIHGVTGSGKTLVYLELIERAISQGKQAMLLVPEISLTPQMVSQVMSRFFERVAVLHSSLTVKERFDEWKKIKEGRVDVVVGARSAIFSPFENPGLIIIDEEHENTYKSESAPRYHAVEIARYRAKQNNAVLVLASATPSVDSFYKTETGKYKLIKMTSRVGKVQLPGVSIVDMRNELESGNMSIFSRELASKIRNNIDAGHQTILFLNRRGYSSFVSCRGCGYVVRCPHCNVSLTYHKSKGKMVCHYCDYMTDVPIMCPSCKGKYIKFFGTGTQKVTDTIEQMFPDATYLRMDADTTASRASHEKILEKFRNENINILVGTQMVTKGLDFENVTLVGILAADMTLNQEDYRASERAFDLITQVEGRAGRGRYRGEAVIQTYNPDNETVILSARQDYDAFYKNEISFRRMLEYPPFCEFINITFTDRNEKNVRTFAESFYNDLINALKANGIEERIEIFEPAKAPIYYINDKYRYRILAKARYNKQLYNVLSDIYTKYSKKSKSPTVVVDVNPQSLY